MPDPIVLDAIARTAAEVEPRLRDRLEAAVVLEAMGYKDEHARALGYRDLFALGEAVVALSRPYGREEPLREPPRRRESGATLYLIGSFYNLSWIIMLVALFLGGQSLWAAQGLPISVSTAIGLGVVIGLAATGGVQQFAAWKLIYYHLAGNAPLARFVMRKSLVIGSVALVAVALLTAYLAVAVVGLPLPLAALGTAYLLLLGAFRLAITPVFAMKRFVAVLVVSGAALVTMFGSLPVFRAVGLDPVASIVASQLLGLGVMFAASLGFLHAFVFAEREEPRRPDDPPFYSRHDVPKHVNPPRFWALAVDGVPYVVYGTLYFVYLFGDRLISWFAPGLGPLALNYNGAYQIGVDLALLMLVPITAVKFPAIYRLSEALENASKGTPALDPQRFHRAVARLHNDLLLRVLAAAAVLIALGFLFAEPFVLFAGGTAESVSVFRLALLGVVAFSVFLANAVFAMALRRIGAMASLLVMAAVLNFGLGAALLVAVGPYAPVLGFLISAVFLAVLSSGYLALLRHRPAYLYYSAF